VSPCGPDDTRLAPLPKGFQKTREPKTKGLLAPEVQDPVPFEERTDEKKEAQANRGKTGSWSTARRRTPKGRQEAFSVFGIGTEERSVEAGPQ